MSSSMFKLNVGTAQHLYRPKVENIVLDPEHIVYEMVESVDDFRAVENSQHYTRGKMGNKPFSAGGGAATEDADAVREKERRAKVRLTDKAAESAIQVSNEYSNLDAFKIAPFGVKVAFGDEDTEPGATETNVLSNYVGAIKNEDMVNDLMHQVADNTEKVNTQQKTQKVSLQSLLCDMEASMDLMEEVKVEEAPVIIKQESGIVPEAKTEMDELLEVYGEDTSDSKTEKLEWAIAERTDVSNFHLLVPNPILEYPFEVDDFQKQAIYHIEQNNCVFVAAHTSAGKTVVAEYAIAMAQKHMTRAIYTSPIKALSNQKFRDFREKFGPDVGLITGDVSINPDASCLVMTTEILRSMLYRGADIIRDIEWVIFDEIHYINDSERGVVWEEVIIMLPSYIGMIFLSATTPNTVEFSDWIGRTKKHRIHVISTSKRPVPLQHFLYAQGSKFKVLDSKKLFIAAGHTKAQLAIDSESSKPKRGGKTSTRGGRGKSSGRSSGGSSSQWIKLARVLEKEALLPAVVFAFSKRLCEECANRLTSLDFSTAKEKHEIHMFLKQSIQRLQGSDQELPQVLSLFDMLKRGIGVHHGGLLPIMKEIVEILFSRGLVKLLFSTETFAMGVNMPARTVVFNGVRKHDGTAFRNLLPGEYTQMAGRAGRRGLDKVGNVLVACWDDVPDIQGLQTMLVGSATRLSSQFRLTYTMILNLLRVEDMTVEDMIKRSFSEFGSQRELAKKDIPGSIKQCEKMLVKFKAEYERELCIKGGELEMYAYYDDSQQVKNNLDRLHIQILQSKSSNVAFCPGRVVELNIPHVSLGVILQFSGSSEDVRQSTLTILSLCNSTYVPPAQREVHTRAQDEEKYDFVKKATPICKNKVLSSMGSSYVVLEVGLDNISMLCEEKCSVNVRSILHNGTGSAIANVVEFLVFQSKAPLNLFDPLRDQRFGALELAETFMEAREMHENLTRSKCHDCPQKEHLSSLVGKIRRVEKHANQLRYALSNDNLTLFPDFLQRLKILSSLGYIDEERTVQLKGRVACEINTCDELILTELVFDNVLSTLSPEEIVAILSSLIFQERNAADDETQLTPRLEAAQEKVQGIAEALAILQMEHYLDIDPQEYISQLNFGLVEVVYEWARGMEFKDICNLTGVQEGSIVRCISRLDEVCREVRNISRLIGNPRLFRKMEIASESIKRDVVFATSLYVS